MVVGVGVVVGGDGVVVVGVGVVVAGDGVVRIAVTPARMSLTTLSVPLKLKCSPSLLSRCSLITPLLAKAGCGK